MSNIKTSPDTLLQVYVKVCAYPYKRVILCERNFHEQETLWNEFKINLSYLQQNQQRINNEVHL